MVIIAIHFTAYSQGLLQGTNNADANAKNNNGTKPLPAGFVLTPTSHLDNITNGDYVFSASQLIITNSFDGWSPNSPDITTVVIFYSMTKNGKRTSMSKIHIP